MNKKKKNKKNDYETKEEKAERRKKSNYKSWEEQLDKIEKHMRKNSINTRYDYRKKIEVFAKFMTENYDVKKFANISNKHLEAFVKEQKEKGNTDKYIKGCLSAVRSYHNEIDGKYNLTNDNSELGVGRVSYKDSVRRWSQNEIDKCKEIARGLGRTDVVSAVTLADNAGLRIHEIFKLNTDDVDKQLNKIKEGEKETLTVKGKNGKIREVEVNEITYSELEKSVNVAKEEGRNKVYMDFENEKTHKRIKSVQYFINHHREKFEDKQVMNGRNSSLTFHGIRHHYAENKFQEFIELGFDKKESCEKVSKLLGHERDAVTNIYIRRAKEE